VTGNARSDGGDDVIALKSGMCKAGTDFNTPTANVRIERVVARTRDACFCTGSEDAGGTFNVSVHDVSQFRQGIHPAS
jgi:hypothetical protein